MGTVTKQGLSYSPRPWLITCFSVVSFGSAWQSNSIQFNVFNQWAVDLWDLLHVAITSQFNFLLNIEDDGWLISTIKSWIFWKSATDTCALTTELEKTFNISDACFDWNIINIDDIGWGLQLLDAICSEVLDCCKTCYDIVQLFYSILCHLRSWKEASIAYL